MIIDEFYDFFVTIKGDIACFFCISKISLELLF